MSAEEDNEEGYVFYFDIDNTLYNKTAHVNELMQEYIHRYFVTHLDLDDESADNLHHHYYKDFGLALEGLVRFHQVDALEYNKEVDDALPLQNILKPDPELRNLLKSIDRTKVKKLWLFTNAYKNHGRRVVKLLGIDDLFDGITYCDYSKIPLISKPKEEMYQKALKESGLSDPAKAIYIDDSKLNISAAKKFSWGTAIHFDEQLGDDDDSSPVGDYTVTSIHQLPKILPDIFIKN